MPTAAEPRHTSTYTPCYHCGEEVSSGSKFVTEIDGLARPMCCPGCRAVAQMIAGSGLQSFYQQRTAYNERPLPTPATELAQYRVYNDPALAATFTCEEGDGSVTASLLLGGISCAACTWLIEQSLQALSGVTAASVNLNQAKLDVRYRSAQCDLSDIFCLLDKLGYHPRPFKTSSQRQQLIDEHRTDLRRLAVAGLGMMQVGMFAIALHAGDLQGIASQYRELLRWVSLPVAAIVVLFCARGFFTTAWRHLRQGTLVMELPVALAIGLAFLASCWATVTGTGQVYFDSVVMFTFFLLLGRYLERRIRQRDLLTWMDVESSLPAAVVVRHEDQWQIRPRMQLQACEAILIKAGETIATDAQIYKGCSAVREDTFSGEHLPRSVAVGDTVYAGTINVEGVLEARVLGNYRDSRLATVQRSMERAQLDKPALAQLADRIASVFVAGILIATSVTAIVWWQLAPDRALWIALSVLVISCPCALALATPAALASAASALRSRGVIVRSENAIAALASTTHLLFDKTGTLTEGTLSIAQVRPLTDISPQEVLTLSAALQQYSSHPIAHAFDTEHTALMFEEVAYQIGAGVEAQREGETYRMGSAPFCSELAPQFSAAPDDQYYWIGLCKQNTPLAWIALSDRLREEAPGLITRARDKALVVQLITGDSSPAGARMAEALGIDTAHLSMSPQQKMAHVAKLQSAGAIVTMVGDGLNDAPVLAQADASFAVAGATDLARSQADFVIARGDLHKVMTSWQIARRCRRIIHQNFAWALGYNLCAIPLAALGLVPPWAAALGMSLSSLLVVANSLRINT